MIDTLEMLSLPQEIAAGKGLYLSVAAKLLPRTNSKPVSPSTLQRWICKGVTLPDGTKLHLEAVRLAGRYITSAGALQRFVERQSTDLVHTQPPTIRTPAKRAKAAEKATERLAADFGI